jgi:hypothetical protein
MSIFQNKYKTDNGGRQMADKNYLMMSLNKTINTGNQMLMNV